MNQLYLEEQLKKIIESDSWMMQILKIVSDLKLNDCWIGAGFVRNKIWDVKHGKTRSKLNDIDVIYYDKSNITKEFEKSLENKLINIAPHLNWSVKNQARMHLRNGHKPYANCYEAITFWPETATSIAIKQNINNQIEYIAPYGLHDLFNLLIVPTPKFDLTIFNDRIIKKAWKEKWNKLEIKITSN
ncbi:nucleotidyltransferase family protein [Kordia sp.]|uniref:nucleotidyltransferase family protein n=1 Tax=Kordia sp. TaxID=1965332 RepID=UPI003B596A9A